MVSGKARGRKGTSGAERLRLLGHVMKREDPVKSIVGMQMDSRLG